MALFVGVRIHTADRIRYDVSLNGKALLAEGGGWAARIYAGK